MPFNRINGLYCGDWSRQEFTPMNIEERNDEVNKALESRFSQLNAALEEHEAELKAMMVPKDTYVTYRTYSVEDLDADDHCGTHRFYLGMIKMRGAWRLCHSRDYESFPSGCQEEEWKPLVEASIEDRINASAHIDKLREEIVDAKEKLVPHVERALESLAKSLNREGN